MNVSFDVEKLANEFIDDAAEWGVGDDDLSNYLDAQSVSCNSRCLELKQEDRGERAKMFSVLAAGYKRAAEIVRAM